MPPTMPLFSPLQGLLNFVFEDAGSKRCTHTWEAYSHFANIFLTFLLKDTVKRKTIWDFIFVYLDLEKCKNNTKMSNVLMV